jgi:putative tryptophan/tyrosine transport system substrate-binding protein
MYRRRRRALLIATGAFVSTGGAVAAQQPARLPRIGYLGFNTEALARGVLSAFRETLRDLGWVDGRNIVVEARFANGDVDRLPGLVSELLALDVDVIAAASSAATRASKAATTTVPIVMLASANAVGEGFVASLARPGGNVTGMTVLAGPEIASKQLELLREMSPAASRVACLMNPRNDSHAVFVAELKTAARKFGVALQLVGAASPEQLENAFAAMAKERATALLVLSDAMFLGERRWITSRARNAPLPAMYSQREFVDDGGLASYGPSLVDMGRRGARQVDKILRGTRPSDIPVEQPTKFEFVINLKTAEALNLTIARTLLLRADEVIN